MPLRLFLSALLLAGAGFVAGCSDDDDNGSPSNLGRLRLTITDAPLQNVEAVNLVITAVAVRPANSDTTTGWITLRNDSTTVNLLALQNGVFQQLAQADVPTGNYSQVRLILGTGSTIVVDGTTYPLEVPSGSTSGLKVNGNFNVSDNGTTEIALDFDARRSVHETGAGQWMMRPVVRLVGLNNVGRIAGVIQPGDVDTQVYAIATNGDTLQSTQAAAGGGFTLAALTPGTYSVAFAPDTGWADTTLATIAVTAGQTTTLDTLTLQTGAAQ